MKPKENINCVQLKDSIQSRFLSEHKGMNGEEVRNHIQRKLQESRSPVARLWNFIKAKGERKGAKVDPNVKTIFH